MSQSGMPGLEGQASPPVQQPYCNLTALLGTPLQPMQPETDAEVTGSLPPAVQRAPRATSSPEFITQDVQSNLALPAPSAALAGTSACARVHQARGGGVPVGSPPEAAGARALAGLDPYPPMEVGCQAQAATAPSRPRQPMAPGVDRCSRGGACSHSSASEQPAAQAGGGNLDPNVASPSAAVRRGFGGILSGVVKEAAETATKRPPVFRYEDFKTVIPVYVFTPAPRRWSSAWTFPACTQYGQ